MSNVMRQTGNSSIGLMARRLGNSYPGPQKQDDMPETTLSMMAKRMGLVYPSPQVHDPKEGLSEDSVDSSIEGIHNQSDILNNMGGHAQQERMIYDKKRSLDRALKYSYQGADIKKVDAEEDERPCRALINPNKLKPDYDDKIVSCNWDYELNPGTVFEWLGTRSHWLIYLQDLTELAYFRGQIRRCRHTIKWFDETNKEIKTTWAAVCGPAETKITNVATGSANTDTPNLTLSILIPESKSALEYFRRYSKFYLQGDAEGSPVVCWRVNTVNWISMPGVIELVAQEDYINNDVDTIGEIPGHKEMQERIAQEEKLKAEQSAQSIVIKGDNFIKPKTTHTFTCQNGNEWRIIASNGAPIQVLSKTNTEIKLKWDKFYSGQFVLAKYKVTRDEDGKVTDELMITQKTIVVETLY